MCFEAASNYVKVYRVVPSRQTVCNDIISRGYIHRIQVWRDWDFKWGYIPGENGRDPGAQGQNSETKYRGLPIGKPDDSILSVPSKVIV